jgi:BirA family biotin operon repressor/biotin-[acetyl-CoA-carboxylase] ligase
MFPEVLLRRLADGAVHSGEDLARSFGVSRAAIWKQIARLRERGLAVDASQGRGYRLTRPLDLIEPAALRESLAASGNLARLDLFTELDSTNRFLLQTPPPGPGEATACLAEYQSAGRGRRGRRWLAPLGGGLCLSVGWRFAETPPDLAALPLAVGVTVRRVIREACGVDAALKWPNDLVWDHRKLGGILVESFGESHGASYVVAGLGINVSVPKTHLATVSDWPNGAVDLFQATGGAPPSRTALAARLIEALAALLADYAERGFAPHRRAWAAGDYLRGRGVSVEAHGEAVRGTALGIERDGALLVRLENGLQRRVISGEVSVRGVDGPVLGMRA